MSEAQALEPLPVLADASLFFEEFDQRLDRRFHSETVFDPAPGQPAIACAQIAVPAENLERVGE